MNSFTKVIIAVLTTINMQSINMEYEVLDWQVANELKEEKKASFYKQLAFNLSTIYLLEDSSYLVMPLNPFGKSLLTYDKVLLERFINTESFPVIEEPHQFYFNNKHHIDSLLKEKEDLKSELCNYIFKGSKQNDQLAQNDIDYIFKTLKSRKKANAYRLHFIALVGDFLIQQNKNYQWGLLARKQLLNPIINLIIVTDIRHKQYFNIEDEIFGKYGYQGISYLLNEVGYTLKKSNDIDEVTVIIK